MIHNQKIHALLQYHAGFHLFNLDSSILVLNWWFVFWFYLWNNVHLKLSYPLILQETITPIYPDILLSSTTKLSVWVTKLLRCPELLRLKLTKLNTKIKNCLKARLLEIQQWQPYKTHPSSFTTSRMVWIVDLYLIWPGTGWGPCIRLLATSVGILANEDKAPAVKPRSACIVMEILFYKAEINYFIAMTSC